MLDEDLVEVGATQGVVAGCGDHLDVVALDVDHGDTKVPPPRSKTNRACPSQRWQGRKRTRLRWVR